MRDPTRGGLSSSLNEIAARSHAGMIIEEEGIPVREEVRGACELLGLDPLYVANEGKLLAVVVPERAQAVLHQMRKHPLGQDAAMIGEVVAEHPGMVLMKTQIGGTRVLSTGRRLFTRNQSVVLSTRFSGLDSHDSRLKAVLKTGTAFCPCIHRQANL